MFTEKRILLDKVYEKLAYAMKEKGIADSVIRGEGAVLGKLALVGEAPGGEEEKQGKPFVGAAGKNLDKFLEIIGISRDEIYITNVVKWRPKRNGARKGTYANRPPSKGEIELCAPFLFEELKIAEPEIIVTLGNIALKAVICDNTAKIGELHGRLVTLSGMAVFPLYHPAAVIYNRELNAVYERDLVLLKKICG